MLSTDLKNRLKRCGRYHSSSPVAVKKRNVESTPPLTPIDNITKSVLTDDSRVTSLNPVASRYPTPNSKVKPPVALRHHTPNNKVSCIPSVSPVTPILQTPNKKVKCDSTENEDMRLVTPESLARTPNNSRQTCSMADSSSKLIMPKKNCFVGTSSCSPVKEPNQLHYDTPTNSKSKFSKGERLRLRRGVLLSETESPRPQLLEQENSTDSLITTREKLSKFVAEKEEKLRKLKMVKFYRKKNDLSALETLIRKWRQVSQEAIQDLQKDLPEPKPSLHQLLQHLQIDPVLIQYQIEDDCFD